MQYVTPSLRKALIAQEMELQLARIWKKSQRQVLLFVVVPGSQRRVQRSLVKANRSVACSCSQSTSTSFIINRQRTGPHRATSQATAGGFLERWKVCRSWCRTQVCRAVGWPPAIFFNSKLFSPKSKLDDQKMVIMFYAIAFINLSIGKVKQRKQAPSYFRHDLRSKADVSQWRRLINNTPTACRGSELRFTCVSEIFMTTPTTLWFDSSQ